MLPRRSRRCGGGANTTTVHAAIVENRGRNRVIAHERASGRRGGGRLLILVRRWRTAWNLRAAAGGAICARGAGKRAAAAMIWFEQGTENSAIMIRDNLPKRAGCTHAGRP
jgi:hypothetical protein